MKRIALFVCLTMATMTTSAQFEIGVRAGLSSTDIDPNSIVLQNGDNDVQVSVIEANYGFHFGLYSRISFLGIFVEPNFLFNSSSVDYQLREEIFDTGVINSIRSESYNNLDIPILVGCKLGFFRVQAGPVAHIFLNSTSELTDIPGLNQKFKDATFGGQIGFGLDIMKVRLDLNYEVNLSKFGSHLNVGGSTFDFDDRPSRLIASLGVRF